MKKSHNILALAFPLPAPITFFLLCVDEPILIPPFGLSVHSEGRLVVSTSCHLNDKGESTLSFSGTGATTGDSYTFVSESSFHSIYSNWDAETQTASVDRIFQDNILINETTGEVWENTNLQTRFTFNANGEITNVFFEPWECD